MKIRNAVLLSMLILNLAPTYAVAGSESQSAVGQATEQKAESSPAREKVLRERCQDLRKNIEREIRGPRAL